MVSTKFVQLLALSTLVAALSSDAVAAAPRVDPGVHRALRSQATVDIVVTLKGSNKDVINAVHESNFPSRGAKIQALVDRLKKHAESTQTGITKIVAAESSGRPMFSKSKSFWISNQRIFKGASIELVEKLATLDSVASIREEIILPAPTFAKPSAKNRALADGDASNATVAPVVKKVWGVTKIQASDVWAAGFDGKGVVVGHIDTGVQVSHEALRDSYIGGPYGWHDPTSNKTEPYDDMGHGTLTLGSLLGSHGIGVAPGATWMSCRACTPEGCKESDMLACGEHMTCPADAAGNKDCSKAPRIVNNSWGGTGGDAFYEGVIAAWQAAGIIPVFANGNIGPECGTVNSPADSANVIAVGMTDRYDNLDYSSAKGPSVSGQIKPDISAPGSGVKSAWIGEENNLYLTETGTSIAAPYVSGVIAILLQAVPTLTYADVKKILTTTTDTSTLTATGYTCNGTEDTTFPNNQYGFGRINALSAYNQLTGAHATPVPTEPPSVCEGLNFFSCVRHSECVWNDAGECDVAPPSSNSGSGEQPTEAPTEEPTPEPTTPEPTTPEPTTPEPTTPEPTTPEPTTPEPTTPEPTTTAPTVKATLPAPTTKAVPTSTPKHTPKPTKKPTPAPTTKKPTPAPTTAIPDACNGLCFLDCFRSKTCTWGLLSFHCEKKKH